MDVVIIQPPLVQLNTPYPSGAYLADFFRKLQKGYVNEVGQFVSLGADVSSDNCNDAESKSLEESHESIKSVKWYDLSNELFHEVFSSVGIKHLFDLSSEKALALALKAEQNGDDNTAFNLRRYVSNQENWCDWIDIIVSVLCTGSNKEMCHEFVRSPHVPRGERVETFLENLGREPSVDDVTMIASLSLADLADYITTVFDSKFALIRYAESLSASSATFEEISKSIDAPVMKEFYEPILSRTFDEISSNLISTENAKLTENCESTENAKLTEKCEFTVNAKLTSDQKYLFCVSIPFAGTFVAGLATCRAIKNRFGSNAIVCMGGGYMNTALRHITETENRQKYQTFFEYVDFVSYDRGYGFYYDLLKNYGFRGFPVESNSTLSQTQNGFGCSTIAQKVEQYMTCHVTPDYSDIDFTKYPRLADDTNPMHRIWSDGAWLKAYLAHGCYWHRCAFCDTTLDYVCEYKKLDPKMLQNALLEQAQKTSVYGVHFVDEAAPPVSLEAFALENCNSCKDLARNQRLSFWGNIRFEKAFSRDMADILSYGGLTGVSGGIEIACGDGLADVNKGIDIESLVSSCAAFKEAGVLVHAYMIYGFYNETPQMVIDSAETLRQLFVAGLIDSAFWHKFTLTKHSQLFMEWKQGKHPDLKPIIPEGFTSYELHFANEKKSEKYGEPLQLALSQWMHGKSLEKAIQKWFPFDMPKPSISKDFIDKAIEKYERNRNKAFKAPFNSATRYVWLGGKPFVVPVGDGATFTSCDKVVTATFRDGATFTSCDKGVTATVENSDTTCRDKSSLVNGCLPKQQHVKNQQYSGNQEYQLCWSYMGELLYADLPSQFFENTESVNVDIKEKAQQIVENLWQLRPEKTSESEYSERIEKIGYDKITGDNKITGNNESTGNLDWKIPSFLFKQIRGVGLAQVTDFNSKAFGL